MPNVMRSLLFVIASFGITILCWGVYGPVLHWGQEGMFVAGTNTTGHLARFRPFICVGLAYFAIGVIVPSLLLFFRGEKGHWSATGLLWSLAGGTLGAVGALGIILAFHFGGRPVYVMPLVFGGAPVVNSFLTVYWAKKMREVGALFLAGLVIVLLGAVTVLLFKPGGGPEASPIGWLDWVWVWQFASIATVIVCWGAYGPVLHKGQAAMEHSRLRPFLCVGLAYFAIAVVVPYLLLTSGMVVEHSNFSWATLPGASWSLMAGAMGAIGALGIILAFNLGGKPIFVMPLIFGGAPVVNVLFSAYHHGQLGKLPAMFLAGLILVIAGSAIVLIFAPRGGKPTLKKKPSAKKTAKKKPDAKKPDAKEKPEEAPAIPPQEGE